MKQYAEHEGSLALPEKSLEPCAHCGSTEQHTWQAWDSHDGGFTDYKHHCGACGKTWWIDGIDS